MSSSGALDGPTLHRPTVPLRALGVVAICFLTVIFDGYDIIVYGSALPALLVEPGWNLTAGEAGAIGSYAAVGMLIGALISGPLTDRVGRRRLILVAVALFSVFTAAAALAPNPEVLGLLRLLAGLGLGGVLPSAIALTIEFAPRDRRQLFNAVMSIGFPLGGILAAALALLLLADHGWRSLFLVGLAPAVLVLPLAFAFLPESPGHLVSRGRRDEAERIARRYGLDLGRDLGVDPDGAGPARKQGGLRAVLGKRYRATTLLLGLASFCCLLLTYGLNTWLPQLMRQAGYPLGSALQFLLLLNVGAIVLGTAAAAAADRFGPKIAAGCAFGAAGLSLVFLGFGPGPVLLAVAVAVAGLGGTGSQVLVHGYVAAHHPPATRASALGVVLALGRLGAIAGPLLGGALAAGGITLGWNFVVFAVPALAGAVLVSCGPRVAGTRVARPANATPARVEAA